MHWFWFEKKIEEKTWWSNPSNVLISFLWVLLFFLLITSVRGWGIWWAYKQWDISSISSEKDRLWVSWAWFDPQLWHAVSQLLKLVEIYNDNEIDSTVDERLIQVLRFLRNKWWEWIQSIPQQYRWLFELMTWVSEFEDDIISLLWFSRPQTYLIILQNTSESRPNGWFFWSFAVLNVKDGKIIDIEVRDSYILDYEKNGVKILWPEWFLQYLPHRDVHFVWANKSWFTYVDWNHIKKLYEMVYPGEEVRGVVFLRTDTFETLIPGFKEQQREWQFTNAATDLIRWNNLFWKKELYVDQVTSILKDHRSTLLWSMLEHLPALIQEWDVNIYPYKVSVSWGTYGWWLEWWLRDNHLTTRFEVDTMYVWEANTSYNKIDWFVEKSIEIIDQTWTVFYRWSVDKISLNGLPKWDHTIRITYELRVPTEYFRVIEWFERKYWIQLTDREDHILAINPEREARWLVHMWKQFQILSVGWDISSWWDFSTPIPTNSAGYMVNLVWNDTKAVVEIKIRH